MERVTFEGSFCDIAQCRELPCQHGGNCSQKQVWERLKQFEDAVQTPENFYKMYGELCLLESALKNYGGPERMKELAKADKDGRVVILPCKVGDTVYARLDNRSKYVCECKVKQIGLGNIGFATFAPVGAPAREYDVSLRGFGKTVFRTREEAKKALQEMEGKKDG